MLYRLSFAEMVVPYGDPAYPHYKKARPPFYVLVSV